MHKGTVEFRAAFWVLCFSIKLWSKYFLPIKRKAIIISYLSQSLENFHLYFRPRTSAITEKTLFAIYYCSPGEKEKPNQEKKPQSSTSRTSPSITSSELPELKFKSQVLTFSGMQSLISCLLCEYIKLGHTANLGRSDLKPHSWWAVSLTKTKIFYKTRIES